MPYGTPAEMESAKQERKDLLRDNPVARDASGGRPWISKHFKSTMSPLRDGHSAMEMGHEGSPAEKELIGDQKNLNPGLRAAIEAAPEMKEGMHMNYDGVSKKYGAPTHQNDEEMEKAFKKAGEAAGKAGAEMIKKKKTK